MKITSYSIFCRCQRKKKKKRWRKSTLSATEKTHNNSLHTLYSPFIYFIFASSILQTWKREVSIYEFAGMDYLWSNCRLAGVSLYENRRRAGSFSKYYRRHCRRSNRRISDEHFRSTGSNRIYSL